MHFNLKYIIAVSSLSMCICNSASAAGSSRVRFHDEGRDTTRINEILIDAEGHKFANPSECVGYIGRRFIDTPYVAHTLESDDNTEWLTVNLDELDCTTFVETALAMAYTVGERRSSWRDYIYNLERLRYRGGEADGYGSRLHYICDWIVDNVHRGNFVDATNLFDPVSHMVRTIDFMSANRDRYPALKDSTSFARIKSIESGYRNHRFPYIKSRDLGNKAIKAKLRDGDVVGLVSSLKNLDVTHMGIIVKGDDGEPHLMHASMSEGKVVVTKQPLNDFMRRNRQFIGIRVIRLAE